MAYRRGFPLAAHWPEQGHVLPRDQSLEGKRDEHDWFTPVRTHSQTLGAGALHLDTAIGQKKEAMAVRKAFKSLPVLGCRLGAGTPSRLGAGVPRTGLCLPISGKYPEHGACLRPDASGGQGLCLPPPGVPQGVVKY